MFFNPDPRNGFDAPISATPKLAPALPPEVRKAFLAFTLEPDDMPTLSHAIQALTAGTLKPAEGLGLEALGSEWNVPRASGNIAIQGFNK